MSQRASDTSGRSPEPIAPDRAALDRLEDWLIEQGLRGRGLAPLIEGLGDGLLAAGLSVTRVHVSMATLHPTLSALGSTWWRVEGVRAEDYAHGDQQHDAWQQSPLRAMVADDIGYMRRRLTGPSALLDYPVLHEFRAQGATDWAAWLRRFGDDAQPTGLPGMLVSVVGDRPAGFTDPEIAALERVLPHLTLACFRIALQQVAGNLLDAYIGPDAGRRVLAGQIERGAATPIQAVVLLADLRGFTRLADDTPPERLLAALNGYLGSVTDLVEAHGGQVLKFLGDGLLAIFSLQDRAPAAVCAAALAAAQAAIDGNAELNRARQARGDPPLPLDVALHLGELIYGNVGSARRLDFTVIGPAVNEASRIEALCEPLACQLLTSASFADALGRPLRALGQHRLRGLSRPQQLFTVDQP